MHLPCWVCCYCPWRSGVGVAVVSGGSGASGKPDRAAPASQRSPSVSGRASIPSAAAVDHAETAHLDTPKERALRLDYDLADAEVQCLKDQLNKARGIAMP